MVGKSIPLIRFPEFSGEWTKKKLSDIGYFYYGKSAPKWSLSKDAKTPCVRYGELYSTFGEVVDKIHSYTNIDPKNLKFSKGGEILVPRVGEDPLDFANCSYLPFKDVAIGEMISVFNTEENGLYLTYYINGCLKKGLAKMVEGGSVSNLYFRYLEPLKINIPSLPEQQKIASFLTDVDNKITILTKKKELLEQYKKGVMQKIFSQELRFKDENGNEFPEWKDKRLGLIGSIISGLTYSPNDINKNGVLVLRSSNVKKRLITLNDNVFVNVEEGKFNPVELNDILICVRNGSKRLIGKNAIIKEEHIGLAFGAFMTVYRSKYNQFLFHFFDSQHYKKEVHKNLGATINSINGSDLKKFKVPFPCIEEQNKISTFLSDIDLKIESLAINIKKAKSFKKGLLQKMFI
ncbi:hypothetical protein LPB136_08710 [Tenacibaculum todarodis]|uniref:Type I restriction modification DNA specificity domain-containing protein n=1 Tax=Tenacibaculum todarodis TaxID=1850252 RepID=A0A1L3JJW7_9FLAO|nr:restriction endonuclease subunit S [Tenacibaculum todarodis]APG65430.1 hypothetical protein LPB136_08710 [Tenacibaculum todarodis]